MTSKEARRSDRFSQLAVAACAEALEEAGWDDDGPYPSERIGCVLGTGIGGITTLEANHAKLLEGGPASVSPLAVPLMMGNAGAAALSMRHRLCGPVYGLVSACAAGAHAIGDAARLVRSGDADAMVAGGSEATLSPLARAAFSALDALSPTGVSRPFDARRDGFVAGEGAAVLVLETLAGARVRGATIYAEIRGLGSSSDAYHLTAPPPDAGARRARWPGRSRMRAWGRTTSTISTRTAPRPRRTTRRRRWRSSASSASAPPTSRSARPSR